jgi:hypothetical protein
MFNLQLNTNQNIIFSPKRTNTHSPSSPKFQIHFTQKLYLKSTKQTLSPLKHPLLKFSSTSSYTKALSTKPIQTIIIPQDNPFLQISSKSNYTKDLSTKPKQTIIISLNNPLLQFSSKSILHKRSMYRTHNKHHQFSKTSAHSSNSPSNTFLHKKPRRESLPKTNTQDNIEILF